MKKARQRAYPRKAEDVPITAKMLFGIRDELMSKLISHDHEFKSIHKRMDGFESRMDGSDSRMDEFGSRMDAFEHRITAKVEDIRAECHRTALLVEEQNARNAIVMDGLTNLFERQERIESKIGNGL